MKETEAEQGEKLLSVVERILADTDSLIAVVEEQRRRASSADESALRQEVGERLVKSYSNKSALSGGASALPAAIPGLGTLATLTAGTLVDMGLMLKFEVELAMCLCWLWGYDIRQPRERQFAFLLASVSTYEAKSGRNFLLDLAEAEGTAIWNYGPRQAGKMLLTVLGKLALLNAGKGLVRAIPLVGVAVGTGVNKVLTTRVGKRCMEQLALRAELGTEVFVSQEAEVVDAAYVGGEE